MMGYVAGSTPRLPDDAISPTVSELQACGTSLVFVEDLPLVHSICILKKCAVGRCVVVIGTLFGAPGAFIFVGVFLRCQVLGRGIAVSIGVFGWAR